MAEPPLASPRNPWFAAGVGVTAALVAVFGLTGLIWLPRLQAGERLGSLWQTICSAAGVFRPGPAGAPAVQPEGPVTRVEITPRMLSRPTSESIGRGGTLALRCTMCHGARGVSDANTPNLAGQYAPMIYKQLHDF